MASRWCRLLRVVTTRWILSLSLPRGVTGHCAEWAPAVAAIKSALPPRLRRQATPSLKGVSAALQQTQPAADMREQQEADQRQREAAAAAADAAMRELLLVRAGQGIVVSAP